MSATGLFFDRLDGLAVEDLHIAADDLSALLPHRWPRCRLERLERGDAG